MPQTISFSAELKREVPELALVEKKLEQEAFSQGHLMKELVNFILLGRGKRLRPLLILLSSSFYPAEEAAVLDTAVAAELVHTASLVHDDIVDKASKRRGRSTINSRWGNDMAVLVGDFLFARAFSLLSRHAHLGVLEKMTEVISIMSEGELEQVYNAFNFQKTEEEYLEQVRKKTAYFLSSCCEMGARLSNMPEKQVALLSACGLQLGYAFQIIDDIFDYVSDTREIGKPVGSDMDQGIVTLPLIYLLRHQAYGPRLKRLLIGKELNQEVLDRVRRMVCDGGGVDYSYARAAEWIRQARLSLEPLPDVQAKRLLLLIADYVLRRRH